ncbi:hypothetical protein [Actinomadura macra]|uniref:hypothetical protein n=1 Tax=Actinomadura macra TaxID=46164 RepID=UPI0008359719|nr:hypothetical protein [Actinomadura macra]
MTHANTKRIDRAIRALIAYEQDTFRRKPAALQPDLLYTEALLAALLCVLEHCATRHGIDSSSTVDTSCSINTKEATYTVGDEVRLTRQSGRCGTIIGWSTGVNAETSFHVEVPGIPFIYAEPETHLSPAPPFPPTKTSLGTVAWADQAEQLYISITARLPGVRGSTRRRLDEDRHNLLTTLSSWCGVPMSRLQDELTP